MRRRLSLCAVSSLLFASGSALAQANSNCPPGGWFCEETKVEAPPGAATERPATPPAWQDDDDATPRAAEPRRPTTRPGTPPPPPPPVVYRPVPTAPPPRVVITPHGLVRPVPPPPPPPPPPAFRARPRSEWGLNLRLEGLPLGRRYDGRSTGLGGIGLGLKFRPDPHVALELGADLLGGTDYGGGSRVETPISVGAQFYVNPRNVAQFYLLGGLDYSHARVVSTAPMYDVAPGAYYGYGYGNGYDAGYGYTRAGSYDYLGGHGGLGLEIRATRRIAVNFDVVAFLRTRVDDAARYQAEYVDPLTGRSSNSSAGALLRGGLTIWW